MPNTCRACCLEACFIVYTDFRKSIHTSLYGLVMTSRLLKITGLSCKRALYKRRYSAKATYNFEEPTNRNPISICWYVFRFIYVGLVSNIYQSLFVYISLLSCRACRFFEVGPGRCISVRETSIPIFICVSFLQLSPFQGAFYVHGSLFVHLCLVSYMQVASQI